VLDFIDRTLDCRTFLAEFDGDGAALPHFGGERPAQDLRDILEQIETEGGRNALEFLLTEASLYYPYCKTSLDRSNTGKAALTGLPEQTNPEQQEEPVSRQAEHSPDLDETLRRAPGLVSPIWRTGTSTILFGCLFTTRDPQTIDVALARDTFGHLVKALAPGLNLHFQMERQRQENQFQRLLLTAAEGPAVLVNTDRDILAQTPSAMDVLVKSEAALQHRQKLQVKNKQLDAALLELAVATRHPPNRPVPGSEKHPQRAVCFTDPDGALKRVVVKAVYQAAALPEQPAAPMFIIRLSETRELPKDIEKFLQDQFDLSQSESHLARHLTMTGSMGATVEDLGITRNTAKTHLRRIYEKTGVNTQLQLARLVHKLAQLF